MKRATLILTILLLFSENSTPAKKGHDYPENGKVVAVHSVDTTHVYTANVSGYDGKMHPRTVSSNRSRLVYRVETKTMIYELSGSLEKDGHALGSSVSFRVEKDQVYIPDFKGKERRYHIEGKELKDLD